MKSQTTIFISGATGFIGSKLVEALLKRGHKIHALARTTSNKTGLERNNITIVEGDILDKESLLRGIKGCTHVFHLAAYAKNWAKDPSVFYRFNVEGMRNIFEVSKKCNVERVVLTSTIVTFGPTPPGVIADETIVRTQNYFTEYEETKSIAEREALEWAKKGFPVVIVNPTRVYGPGKLTEGNSVSLMLDQYDRGKFPVLLNRGVNKGNYVFVDDLVQGHILAMERGTIGERYILGGENASLKELFQLVDEITGRRHIQINLSPSLAMTYGYLNKFFAETFGIYPQITPGWVKTFLYDWVYTSAKAERELGYTITPLKEGIRTTIEWLRSLRKQK